MCMNVNMGLKSISKPHNVFFLVTLLSKDVKRIVIKVIWQLTKNFGHGWALFSHNVQSVSYLFQVSPLNIKLTKGQQPHPQTNINTDIAIYRHKQSMYWFTENTLISVSLTNWKDVIMRTLGYSQDMFMM